MEFRVEIMFQTNSLNIRNLWNNEVDSNNEANSIHQIHSFYKYIWYMLGTYFDASWISDKGVHNE